MIKTILKQIFITSVFISMLSSCENDLQIYSESGISPEQINEGNLQFFLNGLYRRATPSTDNYVFNDIRGGNYTWTALSGNNSGYGVLTTGNGLDDANGFSSSIWGYCYSNIYNANNIIEASEKLNKPVINAETRFIRAYLYYNLVTTFGGVPLITTKTDEDLPRASAEKIWELINSDLDFAISNAKAFNVTGNKTVSVQAAKAMKARVLLVLNKKSQAAALAQEVISETALQIDEDYARIFRTTNQSTEVIFAFANLITENNIRFSQLFWTYGTKWAGSYFVQPSVDALNNLYENNDPRKNINFLTITNADNTSNTIVSKYWDVQPIIINRISEMYLIAAEGKGATQEGLNYLNQIRTKRNLPPYSLSNIMGANDFLDKILLERRREFYSEGFLFYDMVRTDKAINLPNISSRDYYSRLTN